MTNALWLCVALACWGAEPTSLPVTIPHAEQFTLPAKAGDEYRIYLYQPTAPAPENGYPVLYFTDANNAFPTAVSLSKLVERVTGPVVLVGVGYPTEDRAEINRRRTYDLTPDTPLEAIARFQEARRAALTKESKEASGPPRRAPSVPVADLKTGGNEALFSFIEDELKPLVEKRVKIDRNRQAFFGHSYGGLFALHLCLAHPEAFQTYLIASPSLWVNPTTMEAEEKALAQRVDQLKTKPRVIVTLGGEERNSLAIDGKPAAEKPAAEELAERLKALGLDASYREFPHENHGSVVPYALMQGLRTAFETPR